MFQLILTGCFELLLNFGVVLSSTSHYFRSSQFSSLANLKTFGQKKGYNRKDDPWKQCNSELLWIYSQLINVTQWGGKLAPERWNCLIVEFSHAYKYKFVTLTFLMHQVKRYLKIVDMQSTTCHMLQCSAASSLFKHRDQHQIRLNVSDWLSQTKIEFPLVRTDSMNKSFHTKS